MVQDTATGEWVLEYRFSSEMERHRSTELRHHLGTRSGEFSRADPSSSMRLKESPPRSPKL